MGIDSWLWSRLDLKHALIALGAILLLAPLAVWVGSSVPTGAEGKLALRAACDSVSPPMSPKSLIAHFPKGSYSARCLPQIQECGEFTDAGNATHHYPCPNGVCTMYWTLDDWSCSVLLSDKQLRAMGPGKLGTSYSPLH